MTNLASFPPEILCNITSHLSCWELGCLWFIGNKTLSTKLAEGGVTEFDMKIDHRRLAKHPWPHLVLSLRRLRNLRIVIHRPKALHNKFTLELKSMTRDIQLLELVFNSPQVISEATLEALVDCRQLHTLILSNTTPKPGYGPLKRMSALTTLAITIYNHTKENLEQISQNYPPSLTELSLLSRETRTRQDPSSAILSISLPPQLRKFLFSGVAGRVSVIPLDASAKSLEARQGDIAALVPSKRCFPETLLHLQADEALSDCIVEAVLGDMLPPQLETLKMAGGRGKNENLMSKLPQSLRSFAFGEQISVPMMSKLPPNLTYLKCSGISLQTGQDYASLPRSLEEFRTSYNALELIDVIHTLPPKICELTCYNDSVALIPVLPTHLTSLNCRLDPCNFHLVPPNLTLLDIYVPNLKSESLYKLPDTIKTLIMGMHSYSPLDFLPNNLTSLDVRLLSDNIPAEGFDPLWSRHFSRSLRVLSVSTCQQLLSNQWIANLPTEHLNIFRLTCRGQPTNTNDSVYDNWLSSACFVSLGRHLKELTIPLATLKLSDFDKLPQTLELVHFSLKTPISDPPEAVLDALPPHVGTFVMKDSIPKYTQPGAERRIHISSDMSNPL